MVTMVKHVTMLGNLHIVSIILTQLRLHAAVERQSALVSVIMVNLVKQDVRVRIKNLASVKQADVFVRSLLYGQVGLLVLFRVASEK